ncbi:MAG: transporter [Brumimicrobium sp.]|nr:transporter [Brumimicrobium sp.]MCO5269933.1 putative sulfate/molybdate transporter [Brumimicrobium sp.]
MNLNWIKEKVRFDRNEFSGAFGDIGTDLPLILAMILSSQINGASVFIVYGLMQLFTGFTYGIPMAVQPLKAVATIVIAGSIGGDVIFVGGFMIGVIMLVLTISGAIKWLGKIIPISVIRGVQLGLGITLANIALKKYVLPDSEFIQYALVFVALVAGLIFIGNRKYPPAFFILGIGVIYSFVMHFDLTFSLFKEVSIQLPDFQIPNFELAANAIILLALPQIPLSLGNSIFASHQLIKDLFPEKQVGINKITYTYSFMNIFSPLLGGIPVCHGSGGLMGHYNFGGRTGGSVVIYGLFFIILGIFFATGIQNFFYLIPLQILGVILFFESISLISIVFKDKYSKNEIFVVVFVGLAAFTLPYGFLISMILGTLIYYYFKKKKSESKEDVKCV